MALQTTRPDYQAIYSTLSPADRNVVDAGIAHHRNAISELFTKLDKILIEITKRNESVAATREERAQKATTDTIDAIQQSSQLLVKLNDVALRSVVAILRDPSEVPSFLEDDRNESMLDIHKTYQLFNSAVQAMKSGNRDIQNLLADALGVSRIKQRLFPNATQRTVLAAIDNRQKKLLSDALENTTKAGRDLNYYFGNVPFSSPNDISLEHIALFTNNPDAVRSLISKRAQSLAVSEVPDANFYDLRLPRLPPPLYELARDSTLAGGLAREELWEIITGKIIPKFKNAWGAAREKEEFRIDIGDRGIHNRRQQSDEVFREASWPSSTVLLHFTDRANRVIRSGGLQPKSKHGYTRVNSTCEGVHFTGTSPGETTINYAGYAKQNDYSDGCGVFAITLGDAVQMGLSVHGRIRLTGTTFAQPEDVFVTDKAGEFGSVPLGALSFAPLGYSRNLRVTPNLKVFGDVNSMVSELSGNQTTLLIRLARDRTERSSEHSDGTARDNRYLSPAILSEVEGVEIMRLLTGNELTAATPDSGRAIS